MQQHLRRQLFLVCPAAAHHTSALVALPGEHAAPPTLRRLGCCCALGGCEGGGGMSPALSLLLLPPSETAVAAPAAAAWLLLPLLRSTTVALASSGFCNWTRCKPTLLAAACDFQEPARRLLPHTSSGPAWAGPQWPLALGGWGRRSRRSFPLLPTP